MPSESRRILLRAAKDPFRIASARTTLTKNLIGTNSGNLIFSTAAAKMLTTGSQSIHVDTFNPGPEDADRISDQYDHYVIPLANAFRPSFVNHLDRLSSCIEKLKIPVTIFGVGAQAASEDAKDQVAPLAASVSRFCRAVLARSPSIGVRGEFTANFLNSLGFGPHEIQVIGCPSVFLTDGIARLPDAGPQLSPSSRISINLSPEVPGARAMAERHRQTYPALTYIAQNLRDLRLFLDHEFETDAAERELAPIRPGDPLFNGRQSALFLDPYPWISLMAQQHFSFGTRIHGNIAALLAGVPAFVIAHDTRTLELSRYFEIPHHDASGKRDISTLKVEELAARADFGPLKRGHAGRLATMAAFLSAHGLGHSQNGSPESLRFDATMRATAFPPVVRAASRPVAIARRVRRAIRRRTGR